MSEQDKLEQGKVESAPETTAKPKSTGKAQSKPTPEVAPEAAPEAEVVHVRSVKLQTGKREGIEVYPELRTMVTVMLGSSAYIGEELVPVGDTIEITEPVHAHCKSFSQIEIKWVK